MEIVTDRLTTFKKNLSLFQPNGSYFNRNLSQWTIVKILKNYTKWWSVIVICWSRQISTAVVVVQSCNEVYGNLLTKYIYQIKIPQIPLSKPALIRMSIYFVWIRRSCVQGKHCRSKCVKGVRLAWLNPKIVA